MRLSRTERRSAALSIGTAAGVPDFARRWARGMVGWVARPLGGVRTAAAGEALLDIEKAVVAFGTEAVLRYRSMAETRHDNEVPASFLRGFIASRLHDRLQRPAHVERLYTAMALELGLPLTPDLVTVLGASRADVALYAEGRPSTLIALEIFDAATPLPAVGAALDKAQILARSPLCASSSASWSVRSSSRSKRGSRGCTMPSAATCSWASGNPRATASGNGVSPAPRCGDCGPKPPLDAATATR